MIWKDYSVTVNNVDLSSSLRAVAFAEGQQAKEQGAAGDNYESYEPGVGVNSFSVQFWQDFSSGGVDDTISPLVDGTTTTFTVVLKPTSGTVSVSNPSFTGTYMVENYERFSGSFGDKAICTVDFALAAGTGPDRAEA